MKHYLRRGIFGNTPGGGRPTAGGSISPGLIGGRNSVGGNTGGVVSGTVGPERISNSIGRISGNISGKSSGRISGKISGSTPGKISGGNTPGVGISGPLVFFIRVEIAVPKIEII